MVRVVLFVCLFCVGLHAGADNKVLLDGGWSLGCTVDKFTDTKTCQIGTFTAACSGCMKSIPVVVRMRGDMNLLTFGYHTHPGAIGLVRIDDNEQVVFNSAPVTGLSANLLVEQMRRDGRGVARSVSWPSKYTDFEFSLTGFNAAYERLKKAVAND